MISAEEARKYITNQVKETEKYKTMMNEIEKLIKEAVFNGGFCVEYAPRVETSGLTEFIKHELIELGYEVIDLDLWGGTFGIHISWF